MPQQPYSLTGTAAELYERNMVPAIFRPFAEDLLNHAGLRPGQTLLDVACGTGIVSRLAWPRLAPAGRVVGLDPNARVLEVARQAAARENAAVEWIEGDARAMAWPDSDFDAITCQAGIQYFTDRAAALSEMRRVLKPGGLIAANLWRDIAHNPAHRVFAEVLERRIGREAAQTRRAPFALSAKEEIRALFAETRFSAITITLSVCIARFPSAEAMVRIMMAGTPLAARMADSPAALVDQVIGEVSAGLAEYNDDRGLAVPMQGWVIVAQK